MQHEKTSGAPSVRSAEVGARRYEAARPQSDAERVVQLEAVNADFKAQVAAINRAQAVIELSLEGIVQTANENFLDVLGYSLGEIRGKHHRMFVDDAYARSPEYRQFWAKLGRGEYIADQFKRLG
jgi:methyl-accepting chemotaxis protein